MNTQRIRELLFQFKHPLDARFYTHKLERVEAQRDAYKIMFDQHMAERDAMRAERDLARTLLKGVSQERDVFRAERDAMRAELDPLTGLRSDLAIIEVGLDKVNPEWRHVGFKAALEQAFDVLTTIEKTLRVSPAPIHRMDARGLADWWVVKCKELLGTATATTEELKRQVVKVNELTNQLAANRPDPEGLERAKRFKHDIVLAMHREAGGSGCPIPVSRDWTGNCPVCDEDY